MSDNRNPPMTETVEMTRDELDEAIVGLIYSFEADSDRERGLITIKKFGEVIDTLPMPYWWHEKHDNREPAIKREYLRHGVQFTNNIVAVKRLTDELLKKGHMVEVFSLEPTRHKCRIWEGEAVTETIAKTEELARCMAYYQTETGIRVVISDE